MAFIIFSLLGCDPENFWKQTLQTPFFVLMSREVRYFGGTGEW